MWLSPNQSPNQSYQIKLRHLILKRRRPNDLHLLIRRLQHPQPRDLARGSRDIHLIQVWIISKFTEYGEAQLSCRADNLHAFERRDVDQEGCDESRGATTDCEVFQGELGRQEFVQTRELTEKADVRLEISKAIDR